MVAAGFEAGGFKATGPKAASFTAWGFGDVACFADLAGFREATCFGDLPCFGAPLKISCSRPALLPSIGSSANAAIAAMMVQRRGQRLRLAQPNFFPNESNPPTPQQQSSADRQNRPHRQSARS